MASLTYQECRELRKLCDLIFARAKELNMGYWDIARKANMWYTTVWKLATDRTVYPRATTVIMMAKAVGIEIKFQQKIEVVSVRKKK